LSERGANGRFGPGNNANPGGRPKVAAEVRALAQEYSREAIDVLVDLMRHSADEKTRKAAADSLLDRGIGKPSQLVEHAGEDGAPLGIAVHLVKPT
jgi:hypothetical protein